MHAPLNTFQDTLNKKYLYESKDTGGVMRCEVCMENLDETAPLLDLGSHPLCDDLISTANASSGVAAPSYHQKIVLCPTCLTAHQTVQVEKELLFKPDYKYRSALTKDVLSGMKSLVESVLESKELNNASLVLDVGCNDGSLLGIFKEATGAVTIGVDPTNAIQDAGSRIDHKFQAFFDEVTAREILSKYGTPDVITFTNVFAHIENLPALLEAVKLLMGEETLLVIENHYLGSILNTNQFDTFYHEHPRTYSAKSFSFIAESLTANLSKIQFPSRYGGNIRVFISRSFDLEKNIFQDETSFLENFKKMQTVYSEWLLESKIVLKKLTSAGPVIGKGLPGRAVMLISSLKMDSGQMPRIYEQPTSPKVGYFVPATDIILDSDSNLPRIADQNIIIWPWHIADEVVTYLEGLQIPGNYWVPLPEWKLVKTVD